MKWAQEFLSVRINPWRQSTFLNRSSSAISTDSNPSAGLVFYDIAMRPPPTETCCSTNPRKSRYALNFKKVPYSTSWVQPPDITKVRRALGVPASRKFADRSDFHTLLMLSDPTHSVIIGDSFDIAVYLQKTCLDSGSGDLFPPQKLDYVFLYDLALFPLPECNDSEFEEYSVFNTNVDAAHGSWPPLQPGYQGHIQILFGGWVKMMQVTLLGAEWGEARTWHGGVFGRLHDALQIYAEVK